MAKRKESSKPAWGVELTWILNNLDSDELNEMDEMVEKGGMEPVFSDLDRLMEHGWKLSVKWSDRDGAHQASLMQMNSEKPNYGFAVSGRSAEVLDSIVIVWFKIAIVAGGDLAKYEIAKENVRG